MINASNVLVCCVLKKNQKKTVVREIKINTATVSQT